MSLKERDLKFGFQSEKDIHETLSNIFGNLKDTKETFGRHFEFDKYNDKYYIELKTRRIRHNQYDTLFFGKNKYIKGEELLKDNPKLRIFYIWRCNDGAYYWEHGSSDFTERISGRRDRGCIEENLCVHIKTNDLNHINNLEL